MGLLIRTGFWFSLAALAIPFGTGGESGVDPVGPLQTFQAARGAFDDITGLCDRRPEVCEVGKSAMTTIGVRAREAARIAFEMLDEHFGDPDPADVTASIPTPRPKQPETQPEAQPQTQPHTP
jgi:hypothetical protein